MEAQQRSEIEELKKEHAKYTQLRAELLGRKSNSASCTGQQQLAKLEQLIRIYKGKAKAEQQVLSQIEQELQHARVQVEEHRLRSVQAASATACSTPPNKSVVILTERLSHQKQRLDEAVARNNAARKEVNNLSKCGIAAQQLHDKLQQQLSDTTTEATRLEQLIATVQQAQQQAASVAEQFRLHNDTEQLAVNEATKHLDSTLGQLQQAQQAEGSCSADEGPFAVEQDVRRTNECHHDATGAFAATTCSCSTEEQATAVLHRLHALLGTSAAAGTVVQVNVSSHEHMPPLQNQQHELQPVQNAGSQVASRGSCINHGSSHSRQWPWLVQQISRLQSSNAALFKRCCIANYQLSQLENQPSA